MQRATSQLSHRRELRRARSEPLAPASQPRMFCILSLSSSAPGRRTGRRRPGRQRFRTVNISLSISGTPSALTWAGLRERLNCSSVYVCRKRSGLSLKTWCGTCSGSRALSTAAPARSALAIAVPSSSSNRSSMSYAWRWSSRGRMRDRRRSGRRVCGRSRARRGCATSWLGAYRWRPQCARWSWACGASASHSKLAPGFARGPCT